MRSRAGRTWICGPAPDCSSDGEQPVGLVSSTRQSATPTTIENAPLCSAPHLVPRPDAPRPLLHPRPGRTPFAMSCSSRPCSSNWSRLPRRPTTRCTTSPSAASLRLHRPGPPAEQQRRFPEHAGTMYIEGPTAPRRRACCQYCLGRHLPSPSWGAAPPAAVDLVGPEECPDHRQCPSATSVPAVLGTYHGVHTDLNLRETRSRLLIQRAPVLHHDDPSRTTFATNRSEGRGCLRSRATHVGSDASTPRRRRHDTYVVHIQRSSMTTPSGRCRPRQREAAVADGHNLSNRPPT